MKYISTKTYNELCPVAYRQWRAGSHCNRTHGYALSFHFEFESDTLDSRNWVVDFGSLRPLKDFLEDQFDHKLLVALDDPLIEEFRRLDRIGLATIREFERVGCEGLACAIYEYVNEILLPSFGKDISDRVWCTTVEVRETKANMAKVVGSRMA
jgi:6-pyruvoyltetrahydropterin/6-carboxytetrahydropterin synthase